LEKLSRKLFAGGYSGAYSFPAAVPLALVSQPYENEELKALAHELRQKTLLKDGKISTGPSVEVLCPQAENIFFFGPLLDLPPPETFIGLNNDKLLFTFPKIVLCAAVLGPKDEKVTLENMCVPFSFRAARIANLAIRPLEIGTAPYSWEWRLGPDCWLPAYKKPRF
jgi:hypothetical protein